MQLVATMAFGLEQVVAQEVKKLGYFWDRKTDGKVFFTTDDAGIAKSNIWLRTADRVFLQLASFTAETFEQLFDQVNALDWARYIGIDNAFPVYVKSKKSQLSSIPACQSIAKKAVVKKLQQQYHSEYLSEKSATVGIHIWLEENNALVLLDTSGTGLHRRGYRPAVGVAPLKETLAAGMILLSNWQPSQTFWDPFCGSGTLPIEAAMIAMNIAPGQRRDFAYQEWDWYDTKFDEQAREEALAARVDIECTIIGSDYDPSQLQLAQNHAANLGLSKIVFLEKNILDSYQPKTPYTVITNPPYGIRLGDAAEIRQLYQNLGRRIKDHASNSWSILSAYSEVERSCGAAKKRRKLYNGDIQCYLYQY